MLETREVSPVFPAAMFRQGGAPFPNPGNVARMLRARVQDVSMSSPVIDLAEEAVARSDVANMQQVQADWQNHFGG